MCVWTASHLVHSTTLSRYGQVAREGFFLYPVYYGCAIWEGEFEKILPYRRVHFWYFTLQKGPFLAPKMPYNRVQSCQKLKLQRLKAISTGFWRVKKKVKKSWHVRSRIYYCGVSNLKMAHSNIQKSGESPPRTGGCTDGPHLMGLIHKSNISSYMKISCPQVHPK